MMHYHNILHSFKSAMIQAGIAIETDIIADGNLHRFHVSGDKQLSVTVGMFSILMDYPVAHLVAGKPAFLLHGAPNYVSK